MTKAETIMVMAKLSAFYGQGKADARSMALAWHEILCDYDFAMASRAVTQFAKHDMREYATFPTAGVIVEAIEDEYKLRNRIFNALFQGRYYDELPLRCKELITKDEYTSWSSLEQDSLREKKDEILCFIAKKQGVTNAIGSTGNTAINEPIQRQRELMGVQGHEKAVDGHDLPACEVSV